MGYEYESAALKRMTDGLRHSAKHLADSTSDAPPSPDAGDSSALLAQILSDLLKSGATIAAKQELVASRIHASKGSYDEVENTNKAKLERDMHWVDQSVRSHPTIL